MQLYDFEVVMDGVIVAAERAVAVKDVRAAWAEIVRLARRHDEPGGKIRVKDETGRIVILTGVASVLRLAPELAA